MITKEEWDTYFEPKSAGFSRRLQREILARESNLYLSEGGVVTVRDDGRDHYYTVTPSGKKVKFRENGEIVS